MTSYQKYKLLMQGTLNKAARINFNIGGIFLLTLLKMLGKKDLTE